MEKAQIDQLLLCKVSVNQLYLKLKIETHLGFTWPVFQCKQTLKLMKLKFTFDSPGPGF